MRSIGYLAAGAVVGAAATLVATAALAAPDAPLPDAAPERTRPTAATVGTPEDDTARRLATVEEELGRVTTALGVLTERIEALGETPARTPVSAPVSTVDPDALVLALERVEERKLDAMSNEALLAESRRLHRDQRDMVGARRVLEALLERSLGRKERATAMTELGILARDMGDLDASVATLREAVDAYGTDSAEGAWAAYQLVWTHSGQGATDRALELADAVARSTQANDSLRIHGRWMAARLSHDRGDVARARADYAAILQDCGDAPGYANIVVDVERRLGTLR